mgnify:FL=1
MGALPETEKGGIEEMGEYSERIFNAGKEEGRREERQAMIRMISSMKTQGVDEETIEKILENLKEEEIVLV